MTRRRSMRALAHRMSVAARMMRRTAPATCPRSMNLLK
jgi:hypothetical protein